MAVVDAEVAVDLEEALAAVVAAAEVDVAAERAAVVLHDHNDLKSNKS